MHLPEERVDLKKRGVPAARQPGRNPAERIAASQKETDAAQKKKFPPEKSAISPAKTILPKKLATPPMNPVPQTAPPPPRETSENGFPYYEEHHFVASPPIEEKKELRTSQKHPPKTAIKKHTKKLKALAVIIDDLGYNGKISKAIMELSSGITLAILPGGKHSRTLAQQGHAAGREILLHQPMEPLGYPRIKPGPGAMYASMDSETIQQVLRDNLKLFPEAVGINNHMGSRLTSDPNAMDAVMDVLQEESKFFIDSRTSDSSVGMARALLKHVPTASRDIFIDNVPEVKAILRQLTALERHARKYGEAIGIGHPYPETLMALQRWLPTLQKRGLRLMRASRFLQRH